MEAQKKRQIPTFEPSGKLQLGIIGHDDIAKVPLRVVFNQHQGDIKVQIAQAENELGNHMIKPAFMLNDDGTSDITKPVKSLCIQSSMYLNRCKSLLLWVIFLSRWVINRKGRKKGKSIAKNCTTVNLADINILFENNASNDNKILGLNEMKITFPIHVELAPKNNLQIPPAMKEIMLTSVDGKPTTIDLPFAKWRL